MSPQTDPPRAEPPPLPAEPTSPETTVQMDGLEPSRRADGTPSARSVRVAEAAGLAPEAVADPGQLPVEARSAIPLQQDGGAEKSESGLTVAIAFVANLVIAIAKTGAALITGSASMVAEAAHSWADTGNEIFLVVAQRRSRRPPEPGHPLGFGREAYVWSLFAAMGLFVAGGAVSVTHGVQELFAAKDSGDYLIGYIVLAVSFALEGTSFLQSARQARREAASMDRDVIEHVLDTSDPTLRAVFAEDSAALGGVLIAALGLGLHQATGTAAFDAIGSILVGVLLGLVALVLIGRNRRFLVGQEADPRVRAATLRALLALPEVERISKLRVEVVGPRMVSVVGDVDLVGDENESSVAVRLRAVEAKLMASPAVVQSVLSLSAPDEPSLTADDEPRSPASAR
ncbi:cation diffusion facilitator family transporter [Frankia sp. AiPa1]|uniref:cation diffusion facilitator family transporter n=1 Tax=Frankia sp. AiPa1 TaxID=573492 RepID=UPI00202B2A24|nr:cation transporter [Frankia sp. AiPa1]MCL9762934.1 cation transporter [Frankia sp. AiPa1]